VSDFRKFDKSVFVHNTSVFYPDVVIGKNTIIEEFCVIGKPGRENQRQAIYSNEGQAPKNFQTKLGSNCYIHTGTIIYQGALIENDVVCHDYSKIGSGTRISKGTKVHYNVQIFKNVQIGSNCRIGGFCCNDSVIGDNSSIYGKLVHRYSAHPGIKTDKAPIVGSNVVIGFNSVVIGEVFISDFSYVTAGSIVTKDVPPRSVVTGVNEITPIEKWQGRMNICIINSS